MIEDFFADGRTRRWLLGTLVGTALAIRLLFWGLIPVQGDLLISESMWVLRFSLGSTAFTLLGALAARGQGAGLVDAGTWGYGIMPVVAVVGLPYSIMPGGGIGAYRLLALVAVMGILHSLAFRAFKRVADDWYADTEGATLW